MPRLTETPSRLPVSNRLLTTLIAAARRAQKGEADEAESLLLIALTPELLEELARHRETLGSLFQGEGDVLRIALPRARPRLVSVADPDLGGAA